MDVSAITEADMTALTAQGYTKDDLGMLAETEIKALLHDDTKTTSDDPHEAAAAEQAAAAAAEANAATAAAAASAASTAEEEPPETMRFGTNFKAEVPADADEKIKTLRTEEKAAFKRLMDGEIDSEEYQATRERVESAVDDLKTAALTASIFQQVNKQSAEQAALNEWSKAESAAMVAFKDEGFDYKGKPSLLAAYNHNLKTLGTDLKNERRDAPWFLAEAHRLTKADLGITATTTTKKIVNPSRGVDVSDLPPTLRSVPAAANGAVNSDEFAHMRTLMDTDPIAYERAHAALSEAQRDRWMAQ